MKKEKKNLLSLNKIDTYSFIEGFDLAISFSVVIYLCNFLFPNNDIRISIIYVTTIAMLPYLIRIFVYLFFDKMKKIILIFKTNYFLLLIPMYLLILCIPQQLQFISIAVLILVKIFMGFLFTGFNPILIRNLNIQIGFKNDSVFKYFSFLLFGIIAGSLVFSITNEVLSNAELNKWGWKLPYLCILMFLLIFFLSSKKDKKLSLEDYNTFFSDVVKSKLNLRLQLQNLYIIIPLFFLILYCSSNWLTKFSNPENMLFLNIDTVFLILTFLSSLFIYPLLKLIGKSRATIFIVCFLLVISIIMSFFSIDSNYSVDFLKFYLSISSGLTLCIYLLDFETRSFRTRNQLFFALNLPNLFIFLIIPLSFYYFIHFSISYNIIYITFALIYLVCLLSRMNPKG